MVLSGGGARGIIHIGVLEALREAGMKPACIAGTSMGAIVGAFFAAGVEPKEMLRLLKKKNWLSMFRIKASFAGLLEMAYLQDILRQHVPDDFAELKVPLFVGATNLTTQDYQIFSEGRLHKAVVASASIPILFHPVQIGEHRFVDGGVINNMPSFACKGHCDRILGVDVNHVVFSRQPDNVKSIATEVFHMVVHANSREGLAACDALIRPFLGDAFDMLDFSKTDALYEVGYREGTKWLESLHAGSEEMLRTIGAGKAFAK